MSSENRFCALGFFDGVHRGHERIIGRACEMARENNAVAAVVTFDRRPKSVLFGEKGLLLSPGRAKSKLIETLFPEALIIEIPFTDEFAATEAETFIEDILKAKLNAAGVAVGEDFRFGRKAAGDAALLGKSFLLGKVETVTLNGSRVSSTEIRRSLSSGDFDGTIEALGHPFLLGGTVEHGDGRGHNIGFATLNLPFDSEQLYPANGVYAALAELDGRLYPAVTNLGTRPTFYDRGKFTNETHIIGSGPELYGKEIWVWLCGYLRSERRFSSAEQLGAQVELDKAAALKLFEEKRPIIDRIRRGTV